MSLYDQLIEALPELSDKDFNGTTASIFLRNDSDGVGDYIAKWQYSKPIPEGLSLGKPNA
jgi:hypothetical protein